HIRTSLLCAFLLDCDHRHLHSFPTRRSSDLFTQSGTFFRRQLAGSIYIKDFPNIRILFIESFNLFRQLFIPRFGMTSCACFAERSEEHTSELQSRFELVCRLLLEKKNKKCEK